MDTRASLDELPDYPCVSTGLLPPSGEIVRLVDGSCQRYKTNTDGKNSQVYPALAEIPSDLFGICVVGTNGEVHSVGDSGHEFSIMSVSKPFIFALVCEAIGAEEARGKLGANATGLPFSSLAAAAYAQGSPPAPADPAKNFKVIMKDGKIYKNEN
jgi:glutaminase